MKEVSLNNGMVFKVSDEDLEEVSKYKWYWNGNYIRTDVNHEDGRKRLYLHRLIAKPTDGLFVDHINGDVLNNTRENLRSVTREKNAMNLKKISGTSSKYKGVSWNKAKKKWVSYVNVNKKRVALGYFNCETAAAIEYNKMAKISYGQYARLNFAGGVPSE
jgi:hypothetical protein